VRQRAGKFQLNLNMTQRPIAKKYCEGKLKRTLKDELKVPEIVWREAKHGRGSGGMVYLCCWRKQEGEPEEKGQEMEVFHYIVTVCPKLLVCPEEKEAQWGSGVELRLGSVDKRLCAFYWLFLLLYPPSLPSCFIATVSAVSFACFIPS